MTGSFDDRERGYEAKWAHDEDMRFRVTARRDKLLGLWAAEQMGLTGAAADNYANTLLSIEVRGGGEENLAQQILRDFETHRIAHSDHFIRRKMEEFLAIAAEKVMNEKKA